MKRIFTLAVMLCCGNVVAATQNNKITNFDQQILVIVTFATVCNPLKHEKNMHLNFQQNNTKKFQQNQLKMFLKQKQNNQQGR